MDWTAVASLGVFPDTSVTNAQRAMYAASYGLLSGLTDSGERTFYTLIRNLLFSNKKIGGWT